MGWLPQNARQGRNNFYYENQNNKNVVVSLKLRKGIQLHRKHKVVKINNELFPNEIKNISRNYPKTLLRKLNYFLFQ